MNYEDFLKTKVGKIKDFGFEVDPSQLHGNLFNFQSYIVQKALKKGKYAIFADCGLGKTFMQLEWARQVSIHTNSKVLILAPLAVSGQTISEGDLWGIKVGKVNSSESIHITNYEQLKNIDISIYAGVVLDESSILKNFTGKLKNLIIDTFKDTRYKLACTATPAPNDLNEIGNHSEFLDVMDARIMRMRWFVRDDGMNNYRLKGHAEKDFFGWIGSWSSVLRTPSDVGFESNGYSLPPLNFFEREIKTQSRDNGLLFNDKAVSATTFNKELRLTLVDRMEAVAEIVNNSSEPFIIWVNQNAEAAKVCSLIPDAVEVRGSDKSENKESKLLGFANGDFRVLVTKKKIAQFGLNYQHCKNQVFAALDFSFEGLYQAIRRSYRFGQKNEVNIYFITTDTMKNVVESINKKRTQFNEMMEKVTRYANDIQWKIKMDYDHRLEKGINYEIHNGDSCELIKNIESNSIDFSIFSPPFSNLFIYSDNARDLGNNQDNESFFKQNEFLLNDLYRIIKPGRLVAVHTKDLACYKGSDGFSGMYDFTGDYHRAMEKAGFKYHCKITIWTDPVLEQQRTKTQRLLYKQLRKDSSYSGVGMPEYITVFRKWEGDESEWTPVHNKNYENFPLNKWQKWASSVEDIDLTNSTKDDLIKSLLQLKAENFKLKFSVNSDIPDSWASDVWNDIKRTDVLNNYRAATDSKDEKHIAPLQLSVIERCIGMWTNPGEVVFTPFLGIGSEVYKAVEMGRNGIGFELKENYFEQALQNIKSANAKKAQMVLF